MSKDFQIERCHQFYVCGRKALKSPPMIAIKHTWGWAVEAEDGSFYKEYTEQTHCSWCVKSEGVLGWYKNTHPPEKE